MPQRNILVLNGHPAPRSLSQLFSETYAEHARASGHNVKVIHLNDLAFDVDFGQGNYQSFKALEPDLLAFMDDLKWADHFVLAAPMWWGGLPAKLKGLFDRAFVPGLAFNPRVKKLGGVPSPMLEGRTGRLILTADTPMWALRLMYHRAILFMVNRQILKFVGIKPKAPLWFSGASEADDTTVNRWVGQVEKLAVAGA